MSHKPILLTDGANALAPSIAPEALEYMRTCGGTWAIYQNFAMDSADLGGFRFLKVGPDCTFAIAPERFPDTPQYGVGWRYLLCGQLDLETGAIISA